MDAFPATGTSQSGAEPKSVPTTAPPWRLGKTLDQPGQYAMRCNAMQCRGPGTAFQPEPRMLGSSEPTPRERGTEAPMQMMQG